MEFAPLMQKRSMFVAISLGALGALGARSANPADPVEPEPAVATAGCPGTQANILIHDYDGDHLLATCVSPNGLVISGGVISLEVYDAASNGIFRNGFELAQ